MLLILPVCAYVTFSSTANSASEVSVLKTRLEKVDLQYKLPTGFVEAGSYTTFEDELAKDYNTSDSFVVHRIRSINKKITAYLDIRVLGWIDLKDPKFAAYPLVFASNAASYCARFTRSKCSMMTSFDSGDVAADYNADLGSVFKAEKPVTNRIEGHKKAVMVAVSKPNKGMFYIMIAYDLDDELDKNLESIMYSLKFK